MSAMKERAERLEETIAAAMERMERLEETIAAAMERMGCVGVYKVRVFETDRTFLWSLIVRIRIKQTSSANEGNTYIVPRYGIFDLIDRGGDQDAYLIEFRDYDMTVVNPYPHSLPTGYEPW